MAKFNFWDSRSKSSNLSLPDTKQNGAWQWFLKLSGGWLSSYVTSYVAVILPRSHKRHLLHSAPPKTVLQYSSKLDAHLEAGHQAAFPHSITSGTLTTSQQGGDLNWKFMSPFSSFFYPGEEWADSLWTLSLTPCQTQRPGEWPTVNGAAHSLPPGKGLQWPPVSMSPILLKWGVCFSFSGCMVGTLISSSSGLSSVTHTAQPPV